MKQSYKNVRLFSMSQRELYCGAASLQTPIPQLHTYMVKLSRVSIKESMSSLTTLEKYNQLLLEKILKHVRFSEYVVSKKKFPM